MASLFRLRRPNPGHMATPFVPPAPGASRGDSYLLQEMQAASNRVQWYLELHERLESSVLTVAAATWALVLTQDLGTVERFLIWLPPIFAAAGSWKSYLYTKTLREASQYLFELEQHFGLDGTLGWVHFVRDRTKKYKTLWRTRFWLGVLVVTIAAPLAVPHEPHRELDPPRHLVNHPVRVDSWSFSA